MKLIRSAFAIIVFFGLSEICATTPDALMNAGTITLTSKDNGKEIRVKSGYLIQVELEQMGGAGYQWHVDNLDKEHLALLSSEPETTSEGRIGARVPVIWRFKAKKPGTTEIRLDHYRTWEGKQKAIEHFLIKLVID